MHLIAACLILFGCGIESRHGEKFASPDSFRASLSKVFDEYVIVEKALADSQVVLALNAGSTMHARLHEVSTDGLDSAGKAYWDTTTNRIMAVLHQPSATAEDLQAARKTFAAYSPILADAFMAFELNSRVQILVLNCPKAMGGQGAMWMQRDANASNPYLGRADNSCAVRLDQAGHH